MNKITEQYKIMSEEYKDFIREKNTGMKVPDIEKEDAVIRYDEFGSVIYKKGEYSDEKLYNFPYYSIPHLYCLLSEEQQGNNNVYTEQNYSMTELSGEDVIIGFIDTGIQYTEKVFKNLDGTTRILSIWDQTLQDGRCPEKFGYGSEYRQNEIDRALDSADPFAVVPSKDENGHGTFMASVAAGSAVEEERSAGVAPEALIAVVKLKPAKEYLKKFYRVRTEAYCFEETDVILGIKYLEDLADRFKKPLVICLPLGTNMGGHTGASPLSSYLERVGSRPLRALVTGCGNEADKRHHFKGIIRDVQGEKTEISVMKKVEGFCMEIWMDIPDIFSVTVTSPTGITIKSVPLWDEKKEYKLNFGRTTVDIIYRILVRNTNSELIFMKFINPVVGIWTIKVEPIEFTNGEFHAWLPVRELNDDTVVFLRPDPDCTITSPGNTKTITSVSFCDGRQNAIAVNSGRGYTRNKIVKPDFAVPGTEIPGLDHRGNPVYRSGSDAAAAVASGMEALLMEWLVDQGAEPDAHQMTNMLILGAERGSGFSYPNTKWGYGELNLYDTLERIGRL